MMKKKIRYGSLLAISVMLSAGIQAGAAHVTLQGDVCQLPLMDSVGEDANEEMVPVTDFGLLGYEDGNTLAIGVNDGVRYISVDKLRQALPSLDIPELPSVETSTTYADGSTSDELRMFQQALIDLKYLDGGADGGYGPMTRAATEKFQADSNLEVTGQVDPVTNWYARDLAGATEEITVDVQGEPQTVEQKFSAIYENTEASLDNYMDPGWRFSFDPFGERGIIDPNVKLAQVDEGSSDLDRMSITVSLKVLCSMDYMVDRFDVAPSFEVVYTGAYRPYIKGAQLSAGSEATYLKDVVSDSELSGINVIETTYVKLDDKALKFLKDESNTSATLRLICQDDNIDVKLDLSNIWCRDSLPASTDIYGDVFGDFSSEEATEEE